ncbi:leukocyte tyrosine kinase receptor [Emydura macquarii macquarii]|uniref:leukocyte tyrosine kinase receptor n=1 Tax=Emydura macquarii macquarii TaxID=1129001 RepID=UPI00352A39A4
MDCLPHLSSPLQLLLWFSTLVAVSCSGLYEKNPSLLSTPPRLSPGKNVMVSSDQSSSPETSCTYGSSCSWVTSTDISGKPDWVPSSMSALVSQEQRQLLKNSSSSGDIEGEILLLNASRFLDRCEFSLHSPILPWSMESCLLELAMYSQGTTPPLQGFTVEIRHVETNQRIIIPLRAGQEENTWVNWKVLMAQIGRVERPFEISLLYSTCGIQGAGLLALGSLQLRDCFHEKESKDLSTYDKGSAFPCPHGGCVSHLQVCDFHSDCPAKKDEEAICADSLPAGAHCSFEQGPCGWILNDTASPSWSIRGFAEMTQEAPFMGSALLATGGHFLYLRADSNQTGGVARAYSASLPANLASEYYQIQFSVHIFGSYNGTILFSVQEETGGVNISPLVWERTGSWSDRWFLITLQMPVLQNRFHLQLLATWGWNSQADIAVDNITFGLGCFIDGRRQSHSAGKHQYPREISIKDDSLLNPLEQPFLSGNVPVVLWWFTTCGASGPRGPTQVQCDSTYYNTNVSVTVEKEGPLRGVQVWRVPATNQYLISAYGAAGGKGAKNHKKRSHGVFISATFQLEKDELLYILVGQQGEDACPGGNVQTEKICLGESSVIEEDYKLKKDLKAWAGGGGGGGGATFIFRLRDGVFEPLLIAAGGGGKAYLRDQDNSLDDVPLEQFENKTAVPGVSGRTGAAGGGGGWEDTTLFPQAGKSLLEGGEGGQACLQSLDKLQWATSGGFGGGGGACTSGGGGGGYRGGHVSDIDDITADGQDGVSFVNPIGEIFLHPLAAVESHGEVEIQVYLNCSHCHSGNCKRDLDTNVPICICEMGAVLASDNVTCIVPHSPIPEGHLPLPLLLAVVTVIIVLGMALSCGSLSIIYHRKKQQLEGAKARLQSPEYKLSKIRTSTIMTDYNPNYCFAGKAATLSELKEIPRQNISLLRALGHGAFGEVYEGTVVGIAGDPNPLQVAIKTLPEICSEQDEMDFLMEALIISKFSHQNIVRCIGVSLQTLPRFILLELMAGGDMKSFLRQNRPRVNQPSTLMMQDLLNIARDIACGCKYLEENHFIHRDIAARNCLLTCTGIGRVAKIGDFGMARDIYRASYYRKGGRAMLPVKWMPPEAFLEGIFTSKTDTWSFGVLLWEIFSLGYMPYPCKTNQEVLEFVTSGGRMDPPKNCPGPVYRIMTQCWQHSPEYRPNFSTILERIKYCTQDPDVVNTELPIECGPASEDEGSTGMCPNGSSGMVPFLVSPSFTPQLAPITLETHHAGHKPGQSPQELLVENLGNWTVRGPSLLGLTASNSEPGFQQTSNQRLESSNQSAYRSHKTKNLWNPTYGSWVLENICHSCPNSKLKATTEREDSGCDGNCSSSPSSRASPASPSRSHCPHRNISGIELVKLQTFPCGNVNYAYDDLCYVTDRPSALAVDRAAVMRSTSLHRDGKPFCKPEKTSRERDSGLSLSDDLSVTPV